MEIAVFLSGNSLTKGLDTPTAGEGRWGAQLSKMLAYNGHKVDCYVSRNVINPSWGDTTPIPGVTFRNRINTEKLYDLALYTPWEHQFNNPVKWEPCLTIPIRSKWYVHCTFSWGDSIATDHTCYNNKHVLAFPYVQDANNFPKDPKKNPYLVFPLPMPIYDNLAPLNVFDRKNILWSTKDVFHPDWGDINHHVPRIGKATLNAIKKLRSEFEFETHFLSTRYFDPSISWISRELEIKDLVASIPTAHMHELIPRHQLMDIMKTTRITTIVSGLLGSFGESIAMGSVPLCYSGHLYNKAADKHGIKLDTFHATEEEIYTCMRKIYVSDEFYESVISDYREEISYYSFNKSYEYFLAMIDRLGLKEKE